MDVGNGGSGGVMAGSVWERRMRSDQVKGGIKVFGIVDGLNDDDEDRGVKIKRVGNSEKESSTTVRKSRRTWRNRDEPGKSLGLHPVKEFDESREVGGDDETCKELGVCHVGLAKYGSGQKVLQESHEFGNGGSDDGGDDEFFDDEVDFGKRSVPNEIRNSCGTEQQRTMKVASGDKKVNNFPHDGKPKSIHVTKGTHHTGVHKEGRNQDSSELGVVFISFHVASLNRSAAS